MWHVLGRHEEHVRFWQGHWKEGEHLKNLDVCGMIILNCILKKLVARAWTGLIWFRLGTIGGLL